MNNTIRVLDENIAKKIAAGEVVERPASVVKELVENSIDSNANLISIEIKNGGKDYISVTDNGVGISFTDSKLAFIRHATSKISTLDDLYNINQMGFRGEALYSISAVSKVTLISKTASDESGSITKVNGGAIDKNHEYGCPDGTVVTVEDLFYNTPARKKFLGTNSSETSAISNIVQKYILSYPSISFKFINNGKMIYFSPGDGDVVNAINAVYGNSVSKNVIKVKTITKNNIYLTGCLGNNSLFYKSRNNQVIFANNRYIKDKHLSKAIEDVYNGLLMKHNYPFFVINIHIDPILVDVNVHPQKLNVAFSDLNTVLTTIKELLSEYIHEIQGTIKQLKVKEFKPNTVNDNKTIENSTTEPVDAEESDIFKSDITFDTSAHSINEIIDIDTKTDSIELTENNPEFDIIKEDDTVNTIEDSYVQSKTLSEDISDFSYKASLLLDKKKDINNLSQIRTSEKITYKQEQIAEIKKDFKIIGSYLNSYLLVESNKNLYIFDQHAAHERLNFEEFMEMYSSKNVLRQKLLIEQIIDVTYSEKLLIEENIEIFKNVGYNIEFISQTQIAITEVPQILGQPRMNEFFKELLAELHEGLNDDNSIVQSIITKSCKKAVKAGEKLSDLEITTLLDLVIDNDVILTCPHGRPFVIVMTKYSLEKGFGRIV